MTSEHTLRGTLTMLSILFVCETETQRLHAETVSGVINSWQIQSQQIGSFAVVQTRIERFLGDFPPLPEALVVESPGSEKVADLNRSRRNRERVVYSRRYQQWKVEKKDLRNVDGLMAENALPELQRLSLSDDKILICSDVLPHYLEYGFAKDQANLSVLTMPANAIRRPPFHDGTSGPGFLVRAEETTISEEVRNGERMRVITAKLPRLTVVYTLSADLDNRICEVEYWTPEGVRTFQLLLSDYRAVDGVPIPFKLERRQWNLAGELTRETLINVESARINIDLPKREFLVPIAPRTAVTVCVENRRSAFRTGDYEQSVSLELAPLIGH